MITNSSTADIGTDNEPAPLLRSDGPTGHDDREQAPRDPRACSACPHATDAHDGLGTRFCAATTAAGHHRGCICSAGTPRLG